MANEADGEKKGPGGERFFPLPEGYDAVGEAKRLLRSIRAGALATLTQDGFPFASLVNVATDFDGSPLLLMSSLSAHTRHLDAEPRASILLSEGGKGDPLAHPRLTVTGRAARVTDEAQRARVKARFSSRAIRNPRSTPTSATSPSGGSISCARISTAGSRGPRLSRPRRLSRTQVIRLNSRKSSRPVEHMNEDHPDALRLYAVKTLWRAGGPLARDRRRS